MSKKLLPKDKRRLHFDDESIYWDFVLEFLKDKSDWGKVQSLNSRAPGDVLDEVMRKGRIDCGGGVSLVRCPKYDAPTACFVYSGSGFDGTFCFGKAISQETKSPVRPWKDDYVVYHEKMQNSYFCDYFGLDVDDYQPQHNKVLYYNSEIYEMVYDYLTGLDEYGVTSYSGNSIVKASKLDTE